VGFFAFAQDTEVQMTPEEFEELLSGNTMIGEWANVPYQQYFAEDGSTIYVSGNSRSNGTWRVREDGTYCSVWPPSSSETCYIVMKKGEELIWREDNNRYPAKIVEGNQLQ
jgi:hypothetical protein